MKEDRKDEKKGRGAKGGIGGMVLDESEESAKTWSSINPGSLPTSIEIVGSHDLGQPHFTASSNSISQLQSIHAAGRLPLTDLVSSPP